jgi:hypothetical protein
MEDYNEHWKDMSLKGRVVLDLGCDSGSTAKFFLSKGAKTVWGVEIVPECSKQVIQENLDNFFYIQLNIDSAKKLSTLIETVRPSTVKVDIEGAERFLLAMNQSTLRIPTEWYIEGHTITLFKKLSKLFKELGYTVTNRYIIPDCPENRVREEKDELYITVFICRR